MRKITFTLIILLNAFIVNAKAKNIDSLQKQLDTASTNCAKSELYTNIAAELIQFNMPKTREISYQDAGKAVEYVLKAIHFNSRINDTLAIRNNFDCLASAYIIQKKYTEAKWFLLQSNLISRDRKDVPSMINSLVQLASVKIAINDYPMAEKDFDEAIILSKYKNDVNRQIEIEKCLATLYDNTNRPKLALATEKHCDYLAANIEKITTEQTKENKVRVIVQAKLAAEQAKAYQVKVAAWIANNQAKLAQLAVVNAKAERIKERRYLATLKKQAQWPLVLAEVKPIALDVQKDTKPVTETSILAIVSQDK